MPGHRARGLRFRRAAPDPSAPLPLSGAALECLAIVAYRQPIARSGIEHIRGSASDSAIATLLERGLIAHNPHHLLVTTRAFLELAAMRDLADLPPLASLDEDAEMPAVSSLGV